jgi:hypothetical protein
MIAKIIQGRNFPNHHDTVSYMKNSPCSGGLCKYNRNTWK